MERMGFSSHITDLIETLYNKEEAAVRTIRGLTDWFDIEQGVRQGCHNYEEELNFSTVNNKRIENVKEFIYLGTLITTNRDDTK